MLYELRPIDVGGQYFSILSQFLRDRRQRVCLDGKDSVSVDVVSRSLQGSILGPLLFILYTYELFPIVEKHMVGNANDTTIYAVIPKPLSRPQVMESLNRDLVAIHS